MKKHTFLLLFPFFITLACTSGTVKENRASSSSVSEKTSQAGASTVNESWAYYSLGIDLKSRALENPSSPEAVELMKQALEFFQKSEKGGEAKGRVYFQISDCCYYLNRHDESIKYGWMAVEHEPEFTEPYNRLYSIYMKRKDMNRAADVLEKLLSVKKDNAYNMYILGEHYYKYMHNKKRSAEIFHRLVELSGKNPSAEPYLEHAYYYLGYMAFTSGEAEKSVEYFEEVMKKNPGNIRAEYLLAILYYELSRFSDAERSALSYIDSDPDNMGAASIAGRVLYVKKDPRCVKYLRMGASLDNTEGIICRALLSEVYGEYVESAKELENLLKARPGDAAVHAANAAVKRAAGDLRNACKSLISAGVLMFEGGEYDLARSFLTQAADIDDGAAELHYYLGRTYEELSALSMAILSYKKVNELKPSVELILHIGYLYGVSRDYDRAYEYFNSAALQSPESAKPYFMRGLVSIWKEDYTTAEQDLRKAIDIDAGKDSHFFYLAVALEKKSDLKGAIDALEKAVKINSDNAEANNFLGYLYADNSINLERSLELVGKALRAEPNNGAFLDSIGWVFYRQGKFPLALEKLLEAEMRLAEENNPDPVVFEHIGDTYLKLGDADMAVKYWERALEQKGGKENAKLLEKINQHKKQER